MNAKKMIPALSILAAGLVRQARGDATVTPLVTFTGANGATPYAALTPDAAGDLFGTTFHGGPTGAGTAFELSGTNHQTLTQLATFNTSGGSYPYAGLVADSLGNLYGTTYLGGPGNDGTVFELSGTAHQTVTTLATFNAKTGQRPTATLAIDASGNLYGTTFQGGTGGFGQVFEIADKSHAFTVLATLTTATGTNPYAGVTVDASGNLFGVTTAGGVNGVGTAFELSGTAHQTVATVGSFATANGSAPSGTLIADAAGNLYGTTSGGGAKGLGTVFEISFSTGAVLTTLATFDSTNGATPIAGLTTDAAGNLYGTTSAGGASGGGTAFELSGPTHQTLTTLANFNAATGTAPYAGLYADGAGNLFGTTTTGGANGSGTVFELSGAPVVQPAVVVPAGTTYHFNPNIGTSLATTSVLGLNVAAGSVVLLPIAANLQLRQLLSIGSGGLVLVVYSGHISVARLDLNNNDMSVASVENPAYGANLATVTAEVAAGYAGGTWNGPGGITSTVAATDPTRTTALGAARSPPPCRAPPVSSPPPKAG